MGTFWTSPLFSGDHRRKWSLERYSPPVKSCSPVFAVIYGVFGTHWATRIFVPPSRQNRSIRHPTGKYQWASGRIFCTPSSPVHMTFTFMAKRTCQNRIFLNIITHGQFIFLHCITHKNTHYISNSGGFRGKGNFVLHLSFNNFNCTLPVNW